MGKRKISTTLPRTDCYVCDREVAVRNGRLVRHFHPNHDLSENDPVCPGSHTDPYAIDLIDPATVVPEAGEPVGTHAPSVSGFVDAGPRQPTELEQWWRHMAQIQAAMVVPKANEYGATDLRDLGWQILEMAGRRRKLMDSDDSVGVDAYATEVGIAFYAMGKLARISAAIKEGRQPSYDSWLDLAIYATMACRVHTHGGWPGLPRRLSARKATAALSFTEQDIQDAQAQAAAYGWDENTAQRILDKLKEQ